MKPITDIKELQSILKEIAICFVDICERHHIPYYMLGGTMLGAIRHKGFIPWDDDMDFGVPRQYFSYLKNLLEKELPEHLSLITYEKSDLLFSDIIKIADNRTIIKELYKENNKGDLGVNIDLFPLDNLSAKNRRFKTFISENLIRLSMYKIISLENLPIYKKIIAIIIKMILLPLNKSTILRMINSIIVNKEGQYIANHYGCWGQRETVEKSVMGQPILYRFEDMKFYGVSKPNIYLSSLYGDYMKLPPEDKRHIHILEMYWK